MQQLTHKLLTILLLLTAALFAGCTNTSEPVVKSGRLPEASIAKEEAKAAIINWQTLLEDGNNTDFIHASMPVEVIKKITDNKGKITVEITEKLRAYAPKLVNALSEAQYLEPTIEGDNVVFAYNEIHTSGGLFADEKIYLTKIDGRWIFNGPYVEKNTGL